MVEAVWRMVPPGKRAVVLSEETFSKRDSDADYWIIEDELDDERRAASLWEKAAAECVERRRMIFWTRRRAFRSIVAKIGRRRSPSSLPRFGERSNAQIEELLRKLGWVLARKRRFLVWPFGSSSLAAMVNRWMSPLLPWLCFVEIWGARRIAPRRDYACSIIVPARNEAGNLGELLNRLPGFETPREVVFVEGGSTDVERHVTPGNNRSNSMRLALCFQVFDALRGDARLSVFSKMLA